MRQWLVFERLTNNTFDNFIIHYHNYDRRYNEQGTVTTYSQSVTTKAERSNFNDKISFGYGAEYKYDWGNYKTLTFTSQTKGHLKNLGILNSGYKFNDNQSLSLHFRNDDHKETEVIKHIKLIYTIL